MVALDNHKILCLSASHASHIPSPGYSGSRGIGCNSADIRFGDSNVQDVISYDPRENIRVQCCGMDPRNLRTAARVITTCVPGTALEEQGN